MENSLNRLNGAASEHAHTPSTQRIEAFRQGYRPVPISGIHMRVKSPGKQPLMDDWRTVCANADETLIRSWSGTEPGCTNTGLMTGASGGIVAADIDVLIPQVADEISDLATELLGVTPLQRIGKAPKVLTVYRIGNDFRKVKTPTFHMPDGSTAQVELLAEGQQFVAYGLHPDTGKPYRWVGLSPVDVPVNDLPTVDLEAAEAFISCAEQILRNHGGVVKQKPRKAHNKPAHVPKTNSGTPAPTGDNFFSNVNGAALANPEPWVKVLFGNKARFQPGTGAFRIRSEDLGRNLEEDISIHPSGAHDFGTEQPVSPIDLVIEHGGAPNAKDAAHWLCGVMNIDPVSLGWSEFKPKASPEPQAEKTEKVDVKAEEVTQNDEFTPPFDLFGDTELTGVPEMARGCVPDVIEAFAWDEAERIGTDPAMIAMSAIVACAAVIDDAWRIQPKQHDTTWTENARLWLCTVAPPSAKKSPALKAATFPLDKIDSRYVEEDEQRQKDFDNETKIYNKKMDAYYNARAKNEDVPEPMEPERPPKRRLVCKDANIPSLTDILADNPSGVICIRDELAGWFSSFNNKETGDRDRADWLSAYNGGPHIVDRIKRGNVRIPNWSACLIGTIQPERLHEICSKMTADGLMQRFMLIHASSSGRGLDRAPDGMSINRYHALINTLNEMKPAHRETPIKLSREAQADRETFLDIIDLVMALPDSPEPLKHHLGKWDGLFSRLCLTYHMIEAAYKDAYPAHLVSGETSSQVLEMIRSLLIPNLMKFYREQYAVSQKLENARWIAGYIMSSEKARITHRDIYRSYSSKMRDDPRIIKDAMGILELANWVDPVDSRNGRDVTEWTVNPMVHTVFAQRAADEKARRDAVKAKIAADAKRLKIKVKAA